MARTLVGILIAAVLLAVIGLSIYGSVQWGNSGAIRNDTRCPNCNMELPPAARATGECPYCKLREGTAANTPGKQTKASTPALFGWKNGLLYLGVAGAVGVMAVGMHWFVRHRRTKKREQFHHFRCPACRRKLRYQG